MPDITLENIVCEAQQPRVIDSFTKITGARIDMMAHKSTPSAEFNANWSFEIAPQGESENAKQFGERVLRTLGIAVLRLVDYAEDQDRYRAAVATIPSADQDVPDNILE